METTLFMISVVINQTLNRNTKRKERTRDKLNESQLIIYSRCKDKYSIINGTLRIKNYGYETLKGLQLTLECAMLTNPIFPFTNSL